MRASKENRRTTLSKRELERERLRQIVFLSPRERESVKVGKVKGKYEIKMNGEAGRIKKKGFMYRKNGRRR